MSTGSEVNIFPGITYKGLIVQCNRSGSAGSIPLYVTSTAGSNIKVTSASGAAALTTTDTITWIAFQ